MFITTLVFLVLVLGAQIFLRSFLVKWIKTLFWFFVIIVSIYLIYLSFEQYNIWASNINFAKYLLPPYTSVGYFIFYVFSRFWAPYVISLVFSLLFFVFSKIYNRKYNYQLFYREEYWLGAISLFLIGWPGVLTYSIFFLILFLLSSFISTIFKGKSYRLSTYYFWIISAIIAIIINSLWLSNTGMWSLMKF